MKILKRLFPVFSAAILIVFAAGCTERPVAVVNGAKIDEKTVGLYLKQKMLESKTGEPRPDAQALRDSAIRELIARRLIIEEAGRRGISAGQEEVLKYVEDFRKNMGEEAFGRYLRERGQDMNYFTRMASEELVIGRFLDALLAEDPVTEEQLREYYFGSTIPFVKTPAVLMNTLQFNSKEDARAAIKEMRKNRTDFDSAAARYLKEKDATVSGYGWSNPDFFSPMISQAIKNLRTGQYGGPFKGKNGWYLIYVKDREKETVAGFDEVREKIRAKLVSERRQAVYDRWIASRRREAKVEIFSR